MSEPIHRLRPDFSTVRPAAPGRTTAVADFIHVSEGLSNAYLVVTGAGRVVVNTGMGFEGPIHRDNFDAIDRGPIRYVVFTQGHVDHVGGADHFREAGTEIVAQAGNLAQQADDARIGTFRARRSAFAFADAIAAANQAVRTARPGEPSGQARPEPTMTFRDRLKLELGGVQFELIGTPGGETTDSLVVWLPQHGICLTGNLLSALYGHFPNLVTVRGDRYRDPLRFVESLERVLALDAETLLPGHHGPVSGKGVVRESLERVRDAVLFVHDETVKAMNSGRSVHEVMRDLRLPPELEVGEGYGKVAWSVRAIWENYAGWFHARSTTELYAAPPMCVHGDLVELAGGAEAVSTRAQDRLARGEAVEAIHLAEVALAAAPDHAGALAVSLAAHRALLESCLATAGPNFWEVAWLRREIQRLEAAIGAPA
ncbi:MAG: alkyl sulfatase dimerization domain-containing protein [Myxococcota bacterium]